MDLPIYVIAIITVVAGIIGFLLAYLILYGKVSALKKENEIEENINNNLKTEKKYLENENRALNDKISQISARAASTEQSYRDLREWIDKADVNMKTSFVALSKNIAENNNKVFLESANDKLNDFGSALTDRLNGNNEKVSGIISPVAKELDELKRKVEEIEKSRVEAYTGLTDKVQNLEKQNNDLCAATNLLNSILNNNSQRGKWGEEQLHKIAELAGMVEHIDFDEQSVNQDKNRPDMIIRLTGGRTIPVDSKAPMNSYMLYLNDTNETDRKKHASEHVKALKSHIDALNSKAYWKSEDRSVEYVAMVVPYESGLSVAFSFDQGIFSYAMEKNVILLSPMTFYAFLKSVSIGWQENAMSKNVKEVSKLSKELIERFEVFYGYFGNIDKAISAARTEYDKAVSSYNRRLLPTFSKLKSFNEEELKEEDQIEMLEDNSTIQIG